MTKNFVIKRRSSSDYAIENNLKARTEAITKSKSVARTLVRRWNKTGKVTL